MASMFCMVVRACASETSTMILLPEMSSTSPVTIFTSFLHSVKNPLGFSVLFLPGGDRIMRAVEYHTNDDVRIVELPVPEIGPGELLVRVSACGLCASDVMQW